MTNKTSCSENGQYPEFCELASSDNLTFQSFRSHPAYTGIVETVPYKAGKDYLKMALENSPEFVNYLERFSTSEAIGNPKVYSYRPHWFVQKVEFSPTTLRYINIASDLKKFFGSLDGMQIIEIGGGYGGLCKIISDLFEFSQYTLVDLPSALKLAKKYLDCCSIKNVSYLECDHLSSDLEYDLCISNYAFSELSRDVQDIYMEKIIKLSSRGYMLCNFKTHTWQKEQYTGKELLASIPNSRLLNGKPYLSKIDILCGISLITWNANQ